METTRKRKGYSLQQLILLALLMAVVAVLQLFLSGIQFGPVALNFVLVPIVIGGLLLGPTAGGVLGLTFASIVLYRGILNPASITGFLFYFHWGTAVFIVVAWLIRGLAAGVVPALIYKAMQKKESLGVTLASAAAPVVNTGLFALAIFMVSGIITQQFVPEGASLFNHVFTVFIGVNFVIEFLISLSLAPAIYHIVKVFRGKKF